MNEPEKKGAREQEVEFADHIGEDVARKLRAREKGRSLWHGLGTMGTVGWTVGLPTVLGVLLGTWLDSIWPTSPIPWTLALLIAGLLAGILSAWMWIEQQRKEMQLGRPKERKAEKDDE